MIGNVELMERLRCMSPRLDMLDCENVLTAADRIAELVKERDELGRRLNTARYGQPDFAWSIHEEAMAVLRFKLTKAVEALRFYSPQTVGGITFLSGDDAGKRAAAVLAELEGGSEPDQKQSI